MATSQQRCVFVGNIPYDATEEQLIQICEEVGPVVSFRLVIDRDTGKPKGYGFCEYKDEETALSARRNLQGYEINGRQLRVDFAENDKNADRNREQGRGGPGLTSNVDPQKQFGGSAVRVDTSLLQPVGLPIAMAAATVMAGALGGAQTGSNSNQNGLQSQPVVGTDPLTLHLAKMPKNQLIEILSELKVMATQNKEQSRQLLLKCPQLTKAVFQTLIMLGMVTPQMLQMPNIRQATGPVAQSPLQDGQQVQQPAIQNLPGLPPLAQNKMHFGLMPQSQGQVSAGHPNSLVHNQYASLQQHPVQPRFPTPQLAQHQVMQHATLPVRPQQPANLSIRPEILVATSASMSKQVQPSLLLHPGHGASASQGHNAQLVAPNVSYQPSLMARPPLPDNGFQKSKMENAQLVAPNVSYQPSLMARPPLPDNGFQPSSSIPSVIVSRSNKDFDKPPQFSNDPTQVRKDDPSPSLSSGLYEKASMATEIPDQVSRPPELLKLEDGRSTSFSAADVNVPAPVSGSSQAFNNSRNQIPKAEGASVSQKQNSEITPDVESALLQQVLNLTPEQLSSLPPDQQQQVIQLQQMLRQST